jgi:hypothetical protein
MDESTTKIIRVIETSSSSREATKKIKDKPKQKRKVTTTHKWTFSEKDLTEGSQYNLLYDESESHSTKLPFIHQQIKNKIASYRSQDIEKKILCEPSFVNIAYVLSKMKDCKLLCFYCTNTVLLLYENVREPKQWTLDRIDNAYGHNIGNVEIACLSCNLRRRTMYHERYVLTQKIKRCIKVQESPSSLIDEHPEPHIAPLSTSPH